MSVLTIITSYNRKESLEKLLESLDRQKTNIQIFDDYSCFTLDRKDFLQFPFNYGKEYAWMKFNKIFSFIPKTYDYYILIPDDVEIKDDFIEQCIKKWDNLPEKQKICLSLLTDSRVKEGCFTGFPCQIEGDYLLTNFNDLCFISGVEFFKPKIKRVSLRRWYKTPLMSSGVGSKLSRYWLGAGKKQYHLAESLVKHGHLESKMNPIERKLNPLEC